MAFHQSSYITKLVILKFALIVLLLHLLKIGLLLTKNNNNIVRHVRNGVLIFIEVNVFRVKKNVISFAVGSRSKKMLNQVIQTALLSNPKRIYTDGLNLYKFLIHKTIH